MPKSFNILVVDDNMVLAQNLNDILSENGYAVEVASDGQKAMEQCRKRTFDLALIDMKLPNITGLELIEKLSKATQDMDYIIITGYGSMESAIKAIRQRKIVAYETKPLDMEHLLALMRQVIDRRLAEQEKRKAEATLRESEKKYRNLIDQSSDAIYLLYNNKYEVINQRFSELFGYKIEETNAPDFHLLNLVAPKSRPFIEERVNRLRRGEVLTPIYEFTAINKSGEEIECEASDSYIDYKETKAVQGIIRDITERKRTEEQIQRDLKEKKVLLKEIHHRVKNNLQVICSMLKLQAQEIKDKQAFKLFEENWNRVYSMALVHEELYKSKDFSRINFQEYIEKITEVMFNTYRMNDIVTLELDIQDISLTIDEAIPCGLIFNELVSNALKHAFPDARKGKIKIAIRSHKDRDYKFIVQDDGVGIPDGIDIEKPKSLGLDLVKVLTEQIEGSVTLERSKGTTFKVTFPGRLK